MRNGSWLSIEEALRRIQLEGREGVSKERSFRFNAGPGASSESDLLNEELVCGKVHAFLHAGSIGGFRLFKISRLSTKLQKSSKALTNVSSLTSMRINVTYVALTAVAAAPADFLMSATSLPQCPWESADLRAFLGRVDISWAQADGVWRLGDGERERISIVVNDRTPDGGSDDGSNDGMDEDDNAGDNLVGKTVAAKARSFGEQWAKDRFGDGWEDALVYGVFVRYIAGGVSGQAEFEWGDEKEIAVANLDCVTVLG